MWSRREFLKSSIVVPASAVVRRQGRGASPLRIAVVGAGAFGGWTALNLRRAGADVTLVDAWGPGNARASSGGETRVIRTIYGPTRKYVEMAARALALWREWDRERTERFYTRTGVLWMIAGADDGYVRQSLPFLRDLKLEYDEMDPAAAAKRWPQINFETVTKVYFEHEGGYLLARHACDAVVRELVRIGGAYRQVAVTSVKANSQHADVRLNDGSSLKADRYVFACGPWLGRIFPDVIGSRVQPTRQEVFYFGTPAGDDRFIERTSPCGSKRATASSTAYLATCTVGSRSRTMDEGRLSIQPTATAIHRARSNARFARSWPAASPLSGTRQCSARRSVSTKTVRTVTTSSIAIPRCLMSGLRAAAVATVTKWVPRSARSLPA
jgi:glycine/D-amino acid oxidase-like deaminating enzyme